MYLTFMDSGGATHTSKACNRFFLPAAQELKMRVQVGEQRFPDSLDNDCVSLFYHRLLHAIGAANSASHAPCLTSESFGGIKADTGVAQPATGFIACQDFEMTPGQAHHTGLNTFSSPLAVSLEGIGGETHGGVTACYLTTFHDVVMEVSQTGVAISV